MRQIRNEAKNEEDKEEKYGINLDEEEGSEKNETKKLKLKIVYNKKELIQKAKKEVAFIREKIKEKKKEIRKANKECNRAKRYSKKIGKDIEVVTDKESKKKRKNIEIQNYIFRVNWIKKYISENIKKYFKYYKNDYKKFEREETIASTIDFQIEIH